MNFQGINFNDEWVKTKTEAEFVDHENHHGLSPDQLKECYALIVPPVAKVGKNKTLNESNAGKADEKAQQE